MTMKKIKVYWHWLIIIEEKDRNWERECRTKKREWDIKKTYIHKKTENKKKKSP